MENPFAEALASLDLRKYDRLLFEEQCAYHAAILLEVPRQAVQEAAGVSQATVSLLADAGYNRGGRIRYPRVARELETLGRDAFVKKYLTPVIRERLDVAIHNYKHRKRNPDINAAGFNPRANRFIGRHEWSAEKTSIGMHAIFRIELAHERGGYFWRNLKPFQDRPEIPADQVPYHPGCVPQGDPARDDGRLGFPTSQACFAAVKRRFNPTEAQLDEDFQ